MARDPPRYQRATNHHPEHVMLPDPLHPAVVHFPIVFMLLLPLLALGSLWAIRRGRDRRLAWAVPVLCAAALAASAWVAVETGQSQEEKVEDAVAEGPLESHEESAEQFLVLSGIVLVITAAGLLRGRWGGAARMAATVGAIGLAAAGARVGHTGGKLVYQYGAASAYAQPGAGNGGQGEQEGLTTERHGGGGSGSERDSDD
jgi:uncharacterized membrane protein